ncbi:MULTISPECIES: enoyl-CoA hydratase/isomerase family protein [unclassified Nocardioides]|uniref:enoyl-CoA hydratase/isomerase family protein n=1 Tax=unclassified Nocardioides TaxID=2615069 RepID=UPI00361CFEC9
MNHATAYPGYQATEVTVDRRIATIRLNRPEHGNSIDDTMHSELTRIFRDIQAHEGTRAAVLTGAGSSFCMGGDSSPTRTFTTLTGVTPIEEARMIVESLLDLDKPLVCAVNGDALGLGAILASLADVAFIERSAHIGDRHVAGGVTAGNGSAALWPAIIGLNRAKFLLMNAELLTAEEACRLGLVHEVVDDGTSLQAALALATRWAELPQFALRSTKSVLNAHLRTAAAVALRYGLALEEQAMAGPEFQSALAARRAEQLTPTRQNDADERN